MKIGSDKFVTLKEDTHQYFDTNGLEYQSVSSLLGKVKVPFDRQRVSYQNAMSNLGPGAGADDIAVEQSRLIASWDAMGKSSTDWGTYVHNEMEAYFTIGSCAGQCLPAAQSIAKFLKHSVTFLPEVVCYNTEYKLAGTFDLGVIRKKGNKPSTTLVDIWDYKTNERKGIEFDSSYIDKNNAYQPGMKFLLNPVDHMEQCNFNIYSLQLSLYALMVQLCYGVHIGRMGILFIDKEMKVTSHAVPYLKYEAMQLFEFSREIKSLP